MEALRAALEPLGIPVNFPIGIFKGQKSVDKFYDDRIHLHRDGHLAYARYLKSRLAEASAKLRAHRASSGEAAAEKEGTQP